MRLSAALPRFFRTDADNRTVTARSLRRGPPIWAVAVGSGLVALLIVGVIYAILSQTSSPPPVATTGTSPRTAQTGGLTPATATTQAALSASAGPFGAARAAFVTAIAPQPGALLTATPTVATAVQPTQPVQPAQSAALDATSVPVTQLPPATPQVTATPTPTPRAPAAAPRVEKTAQGLLTVTCRPQICEEVIDNGKPFGAAPFFRKPVAAGEHRIQLKAHNPPITKIVQVYVVADDLKVVSVTMAP